MPDTILDAVDQAEESQETQGVQTEDKFYDWATGQVKKEFLIDDLKGKPTITDFVKHYQGVKSELETTKAGIKDYIKIPTDKSTPEEIAAYRKAQGVPESADKYELKADELPEGVSLDDATIEGFKQLAFEMGLSPGQAQALLDFDIKRNEATYKSLKEWQRQEAEEGVKLLKEKHGEKFNEKLVHALRIIRKIGGEELEQEINENQGNNPNLINFIMEISQSFTEDGVVKGASAAGEKGSLEELYPSMKGKFK